MAILTILLILLAVVVLLGWIFMMMALYRSRNMSPLAPGKIEHSAWREYQDEVRAGIAWIDAQPAEKVSVVSFDGLRLRGRLLTVPNARGTVLLFHGYRSSASVDFSCGARFYQEQGFNLLLIDQRAHGESEGRFIAYGVLERRDCRTWAEFCAARFGPSHPLFLAGISMGATTVLMAAGLPLPASVRGIVADCGFTSPWDILSDLMRRRYHIPVFPFLYLMEFFTRLCAHFSLRGASTPEALARATVPVLFIHGTGDRFVPCRMTQESYDACASEKRLLLAEGAGHAVSFLVDRGAYTAALRDFLSGRAGT